MWVDANTHAGEVTWRKYHITRTLAPPYSLHTVLLKVESYNDAFFLQVTGCTAALDFVRELLVGAAEADAGVLRLLPVPARSQLHCLVAACISAAVTCSV
jgi:hypothetical protein